MPIAALIRRRGEGGGGEGLGFVLHGKRLISVLLQISVIFVIFTTACLSETVKSAEELESDGKNIAAATTLYNKQEAVDTSSLLSLDMENDELSNEMDKRVQVFRYGKRAPSVFRYGKRAASVFRYGKRPSVFRYGKRAPSVFRYGKRAPSVFRYGKRTPSVFRYGKRTPSVFRYGKRAPSVFRYGKRNLQYPLLMSDDEFDGKIGSAEFFPKKIFHYGKQNEEDDTPYTSSVQQPEEVEGKGNEGDVEIKDEDNADDVYLLSSMADKRKLFRYGKRVVAEKEKDLDHQMINDDKLIVEKVEKLREEEEEEEEEKQEEEDVKDLANKRAAVFRYG